MEKRSGLARVFLSVAAALGLARGPVLREEKPAPGAKGPDPVQGFLDQFRMGGRGFPRRRTYYLPKGDWTVRMPDLKLDPTQRERVAQAERERREAKEARRSFAWATTTATRKVHPEREHSPGLLPATNARLAELRGRRLMRAERRAARLAS